jgi:hypothetical protein
LILLVLGGSPVATLAQETTGAKSLGFDLRADVGFHAVRFKESSSVFGPTVKSAWDSRGFAFNGEVAYTLARFPLHLQLGFLTFQSSTDTEETRVNGVLTQTQDLDENFDLLTPAVGCVLRLGRGVRLTPLVGWEFQWIKQTRENFVMQGIPLALTVTEDIDANGPLVGFRLAANLTERLRVRLQYSHTFLTALEAENSFAKEAGFGKFESDGDIDRVNVGLEYHIAKPVGLGFSYQFLRNTRAESSVQTINGMAAVLPSAEHVFHAGFVRVTIRFRGIAQWCPWVSHASAGFR